MIDANLITLQITAALAAAGTPPLPASMPFYNALGAAIAFALKQADVSSLGLVAPGGGGPVTGASKLA